jgi:branched-chain amino acid transport system ATP-binding protein
MLRTEQLQVLRAGRIAVADASIEVGPDEAVAIVGPNGAGKSTLLRAISGLERVAAGHIAYAGVPLAGRSPRAILREGIVQVPEGRQLFPELTVQENVWLGGFLLPKARRQANVERMFGLFPRLAERRRQLAGSLSGGEQQILAIARAMASEPRLLMLDEPSIGLSPRMIGTVRDVVGAIRASGIAVLLVEQNIALARAVASRAYVLVTGRIVAAGPAAELLTADRLAHAFLGGEASEEGHL